MGTEDIPRPFKLYWPLCLLSSLYQLSCNTC